MKLSGVQDLIPAVSARHRESETRGALRGAIVYLAGHRRTIRRGYLKKGLRIEHRFLPQPLPLRFVRRPICGRGCAMFRIRGTNRSPRRSGLNVQTRNHAFAPQRRIRRPNRSLLTKGTARLCDNFPMTLVVIMRCWSVRSLIYFLVDCIHDAGLPSFRRFIR